MAVNVPFFMLLISCSFRNWRAWINLFGAGNLLQYLVVEQQNADVVFGGVTIFAGILGTYCGGIYLDYIGSTLRNSFKVCVF